MFHNFHQNIVRFGGINFHPRFHKEHNKEKLNQKLAQASCRNKIKIVPDIHLSGRPASPASLRLRSIYCVGQIRRSNHSPVAVCNMICDDFVIQFAICPDRYRVRPFGSIDGIDPGDCYYGTYCYAIGFY